MSLAAYPVLRMKVMPTLPLGGVRYDIAQSLTLSQQAQARANIGAAASGSASFIDTVTITPPLSHQGLSMTMTGAGTDNGVPVGLASFGYGYNEVSITDSRDDHAPGYPITFGFHLLMTSGGGQTRGNKYGFRVTQVLAAPNNALDGVTDTVAISGVAFGSAQAGGTNTGAGARGSTFGGDFNSTLFAGSTNYFASVGIESKASIVTGASAKYRFGISAVSLGDVLAASEDSAVHIGAAGTTGWKIGIAFSNANGIGPMHSTGTLIGTDGSVVAVTDGFNAGNYTFSGNFIKSTTFSVSGAGLATANAGFSTGPHDLIGYQVISSNSAHTGTLFADNNGVTLFVNTNDPIIFAANSAEVGRFKVGGDLQVARSLITVPTTVAGLPAAAAGNKGARYFVTDATQTLTAGIGAVVAGGGANGVPVISDGTNNRIGG